MSQAAQGDKAEPRAGGAAEDAVDEQGGLSLRGFFLVGIRLASNRLQILSTEIAEEKVRLTLAALTGVGGLFFLGLAVLSGVILLVVLFWEEHRVLLLGGLTVGFTVLGCGLLFLTVRGVSAHHKPFQVTLAELKKDEDAWRSPQDHP